MIVRRLSVAAAHIDAPSLRGQALMLLVMASYAPRPLCAGEWARTLVADPGTVSGLLRRLERLELVTCRMDLRDGRRRLVLPTAAGRAYVGQVVQIAGSPRLEAA